MTDLRPRIEPQDIPPELDRWNWGAFLLNWIWGVGNNTYIALLTFVPFVGIVMPFVLGAKGSRWAWRNGRWDNVEHFKRIQRLWAIWGAVIVLGGLLLLGGMAGGFQTFRRLRTRGRQTSNEYHCGRCPRHPDHDGLSARLDHAQRCNRQRRPKLFGDRSERRGPGISGGDQEGWRVVDQEVDAQA